MLFKHASYDARSQYASIRYVNSIKFLKCRNIRCNDANKTDKRDMHSEV